MNDKDFVIQPAFKRSTTKQDVVKTNSESSSQEEDGKVDDDAGDIEMGRIAATTLASKPSYSGSPRSKEKKYPVQPFIAEVVEDYICQEIHGGCEEAVAV